MRKQLNGLILISVFYSASVFAQIAAKKYLPVLENPDRIVYIDSTSIRQYEDQISAVSLTNYKTPRMAPAIKREVASLKSQILFNLAELKYTVNSSLFYDKDFRIIGESTVPNIPFGNANLMSPIKNSAEMTAIFNKALDLLKMENVQRIYPEEVTDSTAAYENPAEQKNEPGEIDSLNSDSAATQTDSAKIKSTINLPENRTLNEIPASDTVQYNLPGSDTLDVSVINSGRDTTYSEPAQVTSGNSAAADSASNDKEYNYARETNPKGTIFTDGSRYCYQVSSWRVKERAMNEVRRLQARGFDVFITEAYLPKKGGTWYRVRIGYFDSLEEAEANLKKYSK